MIIGYFNPPEIQALTGYVNRLYNDNRLYQPTRDTGAHWVRERTCAVEECVLYIYIVVVYVCCVWCYHLLLLLLLLLLLPSYMT